MPILKSLNTVFGLLCLRLFGYEDKIGSFSVDACRLLFQMKGLDDISIDMTNRKHINREILNTRFSSLLKALEPRRNIFIGDLQVLLKVILFRKTFVEQEFTLSNVLFLFFSFFCVEDGNE